MLLTTSAMLIQSLPPRRASIAHHSRGLAVEGKIVIWAVMTLAREIALAGRLVAGYVVNVLIANTALTMRAPASKAGASH
jgi:hypothetical protein